MSPWAFRLGLLLFFTVVFTVFYAVAYSILLGIRDNYRRYAQKASLQWTGPRRRAPLRVVSALKLLAAAGITAWLVVDWVILG